MGSRVGHSMAVETDERISDVIPLKVAYSLLAIYRDQLRQSDSVAWDVSLDGVSKVDNVITHRGRAMARKVGGGEEVIILAILATTTIIAHKVFFTCLRCPYLERS